MHRNRLKIDPTGELAEEDLNRYGLVVPDCITEVLSTRDRIIMLATLGEDPVHPGTASKEIGDIVIPHNSVSQYWPAGRPCRIIHVSSASIPLNTSKVIGWLALEGFTCRNSEIMSPYELVAMLPLWKGKTGYHHNMYKNLDVGYVEWRRTGVHS